MHYSFGTNSFTDYWDSVQRKVAVFLTDPLNEELAVECAGKLWHLCDWYYEEYKNNLPYKQLIDLQGYVGSECPSLRVMRDICNGSKHASLDKTRTPVIRKTQVHQGAFSSGFSRGFDISMLEVELVDGSIVDFDNAVKLSIDYWTGKLSLTNKSTLLPPFGLPPDPLRGPVI
ncbi:hypothetical protein ACQKC1_12945 [Shewanella baltica]|uniref:hypothetical protein n=1 Tax=Shewanella baltica TaxID=62322 RepID=UPI003D07E5CE